MRLLSSIVKAKSMTAGINMKSSRASELPEEWHQEMILQAIRKSRHIDNEAGKRADEIINLANETSGHIWRAAEKNGYAAGFEQGYSVGRKTSETEGEKALCEIKTIIDTIEEDRNRQLENQRQDMIMLSLEIAKKIMKQQITVQEEAIMKMLEEIILENRSEASVKICISEYSKCLDLKIDRELTEKIRNMAKNISVTVTKDEDVIMVETSSGIVDISFPTQLEHIRETISHRI